MTGRFRVKKIFYGLGYPTVGLAQEYVVEGINTVAILERWQATRDGHKKGQLKMPGLFKIDSDQIKKHPLKQYSGVPPQYFVPTDALIKIDVKAKSDATNNFVGPMPPEPPVQGRLLDIPITPKPRSLSYEPA